MIFFEKCNRYKASAICSKTYHSEEGGKSESGCGSKSDGTGGGGSGDGSNNTGSVVGSSNEVAVKVDSGYSSVRCVISSGDTGILGSGAEHGSLEGGG